MAGPLGPPGKERAVDLVVGRDAGQSCLHVGDQLGALLEEGRAEAIEFARTECRLGHRQQSQF